MNHVIKFIVASRRQDVNSETASCTHTEFKSNLAKLLGLIHTLVRAQPQSSAKSTSSARSPSAVRALISQGDSKEAARIAAEMSQGVQLSESEVASNSMMFVSKMYVCKLSHSALVLHFALSVTEVYLIAKVCCAELPRLDRGSERDLYS